jgi:hypothetical protein
LYGLSSRAPIKFDPIVWIPKSEKVLPASVTTLTKPQVIVAPFILNIALLFLTVKGTANAEETSGPPGSTTGDVGQGGPPHNWYMEATALVLVRNSVPTIHFATRNQLGCSLGGFSDGWRDCFCASCGALRLAAFLARYLSLLFFTESASGFCSSFGASAARYGGLENIGVHTFVIAELNFCDVQRQYGIIALSQGEREAVAHATS